MSRKRAVRSYRVEFIRFESEEQVLPPTIIPGDPVPWQRPRPRFQRVGFINPPKMVGYERAVRETVAIQPAMRGGREPDGLGLYRVDVTFRVVQAPGDIDNMLKSVLDGLTGVLFFNDSQVHEVRASIVRAKDNPFTMVTAFRIGARSIPLVDQRKKLEAP